MVQPVPSTICERRGRLAGESLVDVLHWPGYLFVVGGVIGACGALAAFGSGHHHEGMTAGVVAIASAS